MLELLARLNAIRVIRSLKTPVLPLSNILDFQAKQMSVDELLESAATLHKSQPTIVRELQPC
jgi:hypothetical protein